MRPSSSRLRPNASIALLCFCVLVSPSALAQQSPLRKVADITLPGRAVRFDYQSLDPTSGLLYIAHLNDNAVVIFDTRLRKVVANIEGLANVHGVLVVPELGRLYASATGDHKIAVVDTSTLRPIAKVGEINYPDGLAFDPNSKRLFVSDEHGRSEAVIDTNTNKLIKHIPLGGEAGNTAYDPNSHRIIVAVHETGELVVIAPDTMAIAERHPLAGIREPHGIALDNANHLAFVAGAENAVLALVDLATFQTLGTYPVGNDPDVLAFDSALGLLYVAAESGEVWIYREKGKKLVEQGHFSMPHAHSACVDTNNHLVYFPLENVNGHPILRIMEPANPKK